MNSSSDNPVDFRVFQILCILLSYSTSMIQQTKNKCFTLSKYHIITNIIKNIKLVIDFTLMMIFKKILLDTHFIKAFPCNWKSLLNYSRILATIKFITVLPL